MGETTNHGRAAVLYGLTYSPGGPEQLEETRKGVPIYSGTAVGYETWSFKINTRLGAINSGTGEQEVKDAKVSEFASQLLEGLQGQALQAAMDIGHEILITRVGIKKLMTNIKDLVRESREDELTEMITWGAKSGGAMSRQNGEPMNYYLTQRSRWWTRCKELDPEVSISEKILSDYLLEMPTSRVTKDLWS